MKANLQTYTLQDGRCIVYGWVNDVYYEKVCAPDKVEETMKRLLKDANTRK